MNKGVIFILPAILVAVLCAFAPVASGSAAPLTPSLLCSACEVTAREIYKRYQKFSKNDKWAGTQVEIAEILEHACDETWRYKLAQESFGAHLKVFADPESEYDMKMIEAPEWYSEEDEYIFRQSAVRLHEKCKELVGELEDDIVDFIFRKEREVFLRRFMCTEVKDWCQEETIKKYKKFESLRRKKYKRKLKQKAFEDQFVKEVNEEVDDELDKENDLNRMRGY